MSIRDWWRDTGKWERGEGRGARGREERFGRGRDEGRFGPHPGEARFGRGRDEDRFGRGFAERRYGPTREAEQGRWRDEGPSGRERSGDWMGGGRPEGGPRNVDEGRFPAHPLSHRYRGYEEEPEAFTGPRGTGGREELRGGGLDTWDAGGGPGGYTGWGIERYGAEGDRSYPPGHLHEGRTEGTAFPDRFMQRRFEDEFPTERTAPRRGRGPRNYQRPDARIHDDVNERLMREWMDASDVDVRVENGEVTLTGFVDTREEKRAIEDVAVNVLGVKDVHNQLRVDPEQHQRDRERGRMTEEQAQRH